MSDCIERMRVLEELQKIGGCGAAPDTWSAGWDKAIDEAYNRILGLPAADVAPVVHGRWKWLGPNGLVADCMCGTCSACKIRSEYIVNTTVCPNCGAKMDGGTK